jgi:hypothetical protein
VQRPLWYKGRHVPKARQSNEKFGQEMLRNGLFLDEILYQKSTNKSFCWKELARFLGVKPEHLKRMIWRWNNLKIKYETTPAQDLPAKSSRFNNKLRYKAFVEQGGNRRPMDPKVIFQILFPKTDCTGKEFPSWSGDSRQPSSQAEESAFAADASDAAAVTASESLATGCLGGGLDVATKCAAQASGSVARAAAGSAMLAGKYSSRASVLQNPVRHRLPRQPQLGGRSAVARYLHVKLPAGGGGQGPAAGGGSRAANAKQVFAFTLH